MCGAFDLFSKYTRNFVLRKFEEIEVYIFKFHEFDLKFMRDAKNGKFPNFSVK